MPDPFWVILPDQSREGGACWGAGPTGDITLGERRSISLKVLPNGRRSLAVRKHCTAVSETLSGKSRAHARPRARAPRGRAGRGEAGEGGTWAKRSRRSGGFPHGIHASWSR
jgi:hypothetical protein